MLKYIETVHTKRIYGIFQTKLVDNKESMFWRALSAGRYAIRSIVILPNEASNSKSRKKCLISIEGEADGSVDEKSIEDELINNEPIDAAPVAERELIIQKMEYNISGKTVSMADIKYEIIKTIGVLSESPKGWKKELNLISWNGGIPKFDIRDWAPGHEKMGKSAE